MSSEDRPDSLAAQAASWVPPWERQQPPDRAYQAAAMAEEEDVPAELAPLPAALVGPCVAEFLAGDSRSRRPDKLAS